MIAYKATNNGKCINITYEVGKTYTFEGDLIVCQQGFHFCKNIADVFDYYLKDKSTKIFEIEVLGDIIDEGNKSVTNKFKILKEFDFSGKTLESKDKKLTFDANNNLIYEKNSKGFWIKYEYDKNNNLIYEEYFNGFWIKNKYDSNNLIYHENSYGLWEKKKYDSNNNLIYKESSNNKKYSIKIS